MAKISVLAHADLDGTVSAINVYNAVNDKNNFRYQLTGYGSIVKSFTSLAVESPDIMFIVDINFSLHHFEEFKKYPNIKYIYIDHHQYEYDLELETSTLGVDITVVHNTDYCGAVNTFLYLSSSKNFNFISWKKNKENLKELNRITNIYDLFKKEDPDFFSVASPLNDLYWEYKGDFFSRFKKGYFLTDEDRQIQEKVQKERDLYLQESVQNHSIVNPYANAIFILNQVCRFPNDFALYYAGYDFYLILNKRVENTFNYSLRINSKNSILLTDIIKELENKNANLISIGGHIKSGGITVHEDHNTEFLNIFNEVLENLFDKI